MNARMLKWGHNMVLQVGLTFISKMVKVGITHAQL